MSEPISPIIQSTLSHSARMENIKKILLDVYDIEIKKLDIFLGDTPATDEELAHEVAASMNRISAGDFEEITDFDDDDHEDMVGYDISASKSDL
jgi:hypothetical protein